MMSTASARKAMRESFSVQDPGLVNVTMFDVEHVLVERGWDKMISLGVGMSERNACYWQDFGGHLVLQRQDQRFPFEIVWSSKDYKACTASYWMKSIDELESFAARVDRLAERADFFAKRREIARSFREKAFKAQFRKLAEPKWRWRAEWRAADVKVDVYMGTNGSGRIYSARARHRVSTPEQRHAAPSAIAEQLSYILANDTSGWGKWYRTQAIPDPGAGWEGGALRTPQREERWE